MLTIIKQQIESEEKTQKSQTLNPKDPEHHKGMIVLLNNKKKINDLIAMGDFDKFKDNDPCIFVEMLFGYENDISFDDFISFYEDILKIPIERRSIKVPIFN